MLKELYLLWLRLAAPQELHYINGADTLPPPLPPDEERAALAALAAGRPQARDLLITHNLRLVVYIAKKFETPSAGIEDMISIGTIGLIKAVNTFEPTKNIKLATYASRCIENEVLMHFRGSRKSAGDLSLSDSIDTDSDGNSLSLIDVLADEEDMSERVVQTDLCQHLSQLIDNVLDEREAEILRLRYGLNGDAALTQRETARRCGISRSYVSRLEKKALEKLKRKLEEE